MAEIITYKKDGERGKYCQIRYSDGNRILISLAQSGIRIYKMKLMGLLPGKIIFDVSTSDLFSNKKALLRLSEYSLEPDMLDVMKDIALRCKGLTELTAVLDKIFQDD